MDRKKIIQAVIAIAIVIAGFFGVRLVVVDDGATSQPAETQVTTPAE